MLATLLAWQVTGLDRSSRRVARAFLPSSLLCYPVLPVSNAHRERAYHRTMREGLSPA
jgi:chromate transporter